MKKRLILLIVAGITAIAFSSHAIANNMQSINWESQKQNYPRCCNLKDFLNNDCQLKWYDFTLFGTIDMGVGWQSRGAAFNSIWEAGEAYLISSNSNQSKWGLAPNGLSQSFIGIKYDHPLLPEWSFIFDLEAGFDPYTLRLANGTHAVKQNEGVAPEHQSSHADSSRAGQFYNQQGYIGLESKNYGTLTFLRQNSLTLDGVYAYDPMRASYAFSSIGFANFTGGAGDTEDARYTTSVKYRLKLANFRIAALYQFGGYGQNNGADGAYQLQFGMDVPHGNCGELSFDAIGSYIQDAVNLGIGPTPTYFLTATISDNSSAMLLAKYSFGRIKLFTGYEGIRYAPPSHKYAAFTDLAGDHVTHVNNNYYDIHHRIMQVFWAGIRYKVINCLDLIGAYYYYNQNSFGLINCANSSSPMCHGSLNVVSFAADWRVAKKFDAYAGLMHSHVNGGLASGYLHRSTVDPTVGLRFTF